MGTSWRGESVKQGEGCLNSTSTSRSRPWVATHTGLRGGLSPPPLRTPGSFHCALSLAGCVSGAPPIAANAAAARSSHFRFGPARKKNLAVSHRSFDVVLSAARGFFKVKTMCLILLSSFHIAGAEKYLFCIAFGRAQKSRRREWWKTARLFARVVTRPEGTAQRRDFAAITVAPET